MKKTRVLIADDHQMVRLAISDLVHGTDKNWEVCAEVSDGREAVDKAAELKPDLVLLDFAMPVMDGIDAGKRIRALLPHTPVLVYTFMASAHIEVLAKEAGLQGVVEKADTKALISGIRRVLSAPSGAEPPSADAASKAKAYDLDKLNWELDAALGELRETSDSARRIELLQVVRMLLGRADTVVRKIEVELLRSDT